MVANTTAPTQKPIPALLEDQRCRLEASLTKLRKALDNWRIYSFEYEAFREELAALPEGASREDMVSEFISVFSCMVCDGGLTCERARIVESRA